MTWKKLSIKNRMFPFSNSNYFYDTYIATIYIYDLLKIKLSLRLCTHFNVIFFYYSNYSKYFVTEYLKFVKNISNEIEII